MATKTRKINEVKSILNTETAYVVGTSWCRVEEGIDKEIPVVDIDKYLRLLEEKKNVDPEDEEKNRGIEEKLDEILSLEDRWEITSCLREASKKDIKAWFEKREMAIMAEESACGFALDRKTSKKVLHRDVGIWGGEDWVTIDK